MKTYRLYLVLILLAVTLGSGPVFSMNIDFSHQQEASEWRVSNDTVMGGRSNSAVSLVGEALRFTGNLSLENNGGFTSVWRQPVFPLMNSKMPVIINVQGDGRTYQLRFRTRRVPDISYYATFRTSAGEDSVHTFSQTDFVAVWRGRVIRNAPPFRFEDAVQVGFLLNDKNQGKFDLTIKQISQQQSI